RWNDTRSMLVRTSGGVPPVQATQRHFGRRSKDQSHKCAHNGGMPTRDPRVEVAHMRRAPPGAEPNRSSTGPRAETRAARSFEEGVAVGRNATDHDRRVRESIEQVDLSEL